MNRRRTAPAAPAASLPGFTDLEEIDRGGFATVYRAREDDTGQLVALKVLNVTDGLPHAIESFRRETQALALLRQHPNIVTLYRAIVLGDRRPMLVLELCPSSVAHHLASEGTFDARAVVETGIKIAGALESAHQHGMLHRDVKPQNILLTAMGEPALADFGVARLKPQTGHTVGVFSFTSLHAAPELLEGTEASPATDVYALASTLYQMLSGKAAFARFDDEAPAAVVLRIIRDDPSPIVRLDVPVDLSTLLVEAMAKSPDARPRHAAELAQRLQAIQVAQGWPVTPYALVDPSGQGRFVALESAPPAIAPLAPFASDAEPPAVTPTAAARVGITEAPVGPVPVPADVTVPPLWQETTATLQESLDEPQKRPRATRLAIGIAFLVVLAVAVVVALTR